MGQGDKFNKGENVNKYGDISPLIEKQEVTNTMGCSLIEKFLIGILVAIIAMFIGFLVFDNWPKETSNNPLVATMSSNNDTPNHNNEQKVQLLMEKLDKCEKNTNTLNTKLEKEKDSHKKLKASCGSLQSSYELMQKLEKLYKERVEDKNEVLSGKNETIEAFKTALDAVKDELLIIREQMANMKTQLLTLEEEQKSTDEACTSTLCQGLKGAITFANLIIGKVE